MSNIKWASYALITITGGNDDLLSIRNVDSHHGPYWFLPGGFGHKRDSTPFDTLSYWLRRQIGMTPTKQEPVYIDRREYSYPVYIYEMSIICDEYVSALFTQKGMDEDLEKDFLARSNVLSDHYYLRAHIRMLESMRIQ